MLLLSPIVCLLSLFLAINYGYLYLLFATMATTFQGDYHFSTGSTGLSYLGLGVGSLIGLVCISILSDKIAYRRLARGKYKPEHRLIPMILGTPFLPIGLFWYGWSAQADAHWILPILGTAVFGIGMVSTLIPIMAYLVDAFTVHAASALAASTLLRAVVAAVLPLAAPRMYARLGLGWGNSLLAFISLGMLPVPWLFFFSGRGYDSEVRRNCR
jgi:MFS family permease